MPAVPPDRGRIAILLRSLDGGGMQRNVVNLGNAFVARGYAVDLLVATAQGGMREQIPAAIQLLPLAGSSHAIARAWPVLADPCKVGTFWPLLSLPGPRLFRHLRALTRYLRERAPAALLALGTQANLAALWAKRLADSDTRVVISEHNVMSAVMRHARRRFRRAYPRIAAKVYPWADGIVTVSEAIATDLSATLALPRERITTIANPVGAEVAAAARQPVDHPWIGREAAPVILAVSRLHWQKDLPILLRAFARVRAIRDARLVILGEGAERPRLETLALRLGIAGDVLLPGFVSNPYVWMARARVFVLSSLLEGFGNVLIEALACGCPVVSTDCPGGPREALADGLYGRLVPVGDDRALAAAILATLEASPNCDLLRAHAAMYSVERAADGYLDLLLDGSQHA